MSLSKRSFELSVKYFGENSLISLISMKYLLIEFIDSPNKSYLKLAE